MVIEQGMKLAGFRHNGVNMNSKALAENVKQNLFSFLVFSLLTVVVAACGGDKKPVTQNLVGKQVAPTIKHGTLDITEGSFTVAPGKYQSFKVAVVDGVTKPMIEGTFSASGGNNDVEVFVMEENQFLNWQNGHTSNATYTSGRVTAGKLKVQLPEEAGTYYVVFSNRFSYITNKAVTASLKLAYDVQS